MRIGFDFDGVIANKPPFIPKSLIEYLFKGGTKGLLYKFPNNKLDQLVRKLSHIYLFRPPLFDNLKLLKKLHSLGEHKLFLITARYSFLENETYVWLKQRGLSDVFDEVIINLDNKQPHLFKERVCKKYEINHYFEDDIKIVEYLRKKVSNMGVTYVVEDNDSYLRKLSKK